MFIMKVFAICFILVISACGTIAVPVTSLVYQINVYCIRFFISRKMYR